jgi:hypothetical protein
LKNKGREDSGKQRIWTRTENKSEGESEGGREMKMKRNEPFTNKGVN